MGRLGGGWGGERGGWGGERSEEVGTSGSLTNMLRGIIPIVCISISLSGWVALSHASFRADVVCGKGDRDMHCLSITYTGLTQLSSR